MNHATEPEDMSAEVAAQELAEILAEGVLRLERQKANLGNIVPADEGAAAVTADTPNGCSLGNVSD